MTIKKPARATQKVFRSYKGQPRKVADLVRSSIEYPTVEAVLHGFKTIVSDSSIGVLSIKNRFDPSKDANASAG